MNRCISLLLYAVAALHSHGAQAADVVVNPSVEQETLSINVCRLVFTMKLLRWPNGKRVRVFVLSDSDPIHREFSKQILHLYPRQLRRVWDRHLFSGAGAVPIEVDSAEEMARRIAETPGSIGYLPDGFRTESVQVIHVE